MCTNVLSSACQYIRNTDLLLHFQPITEQLTSCNFISVLWLVKRLEEGWNFFALRAQSKSSRLKIFPTKTTCCLWHQRETPTIRYKAPGQSQIKVYLVHWIWLTVCDFLYCYFRTTAVNQFFFYCGEPRYIERCLKGQNDLQSWAIGAVRAVWKYFAKASYFSG